MFASLADGRAYMATTMIKQRKWPIQIEQYAIRFLFGILRRMAIRYNRVIDSYIEVARRSLRNQIEVAIERKS